MKSFHRLLGLIVPLMLLSTPGFSQRAGGYIRRTPKPKVVKKTTTPAPKPRKKTNATPAPHRRPAMSAAERTRREAQARQEEQARHEREQARQKEQARQEAEARERELAQQREIARQEHARNLRFEHPEIINNLILNMVFVKGGKFKMGSDAKKADHYERPVHEVSLRDFSIGRYEVTQEEWEAVMGYNPSSFKLPKRPVENVSWEEC